MRIRVLLAGGGTGGHVYPLLAVAEAAEGWEISYAGTAEGLEAGIVRREGIPFHALSAGGVRGKRLVTRVRGVLRIAAGIASAVRLLGRIRPDAVLSSGGYAAAPVAFAAVLRHVPLILLEPNAAPGLANRLLLGRADRVLLGYEDSATAISAVAGGRTEVTGVPVRERLFSGERIHARGELGIPEDAVVVVVVGGSRGATALNRAAQAMAPQLPREAYLLWATGERDWPTYQGVQADRLRVEPYFWDMPSVYAAADLVISRSGAGFCAELTALGLPSILVPSPNVVADHQTQNARVLSRAGAAVLVPEAELDSGRLLEQVRRLVRDGAVRRAMAEASRALGRPDAARQAARAVEGVVLRRRGSTGKSTRGR